jgi:CubicO group peptidase (beta-lactamase class C family)
MQPTSRFGEVFQYSNLMAAAAGYVAAHAISPHQELGAAYDEAMRAKVFEPLAMTCTTFDFSQAMHGNFASPHGDDVDGNTRPARMDHNYSAVPFRPAGGVWTSARDLPRYLQMELARGELPSGKRLLSEENLLERRRAQVSIGEDAIYGMGLEVSTLRHPGCEPRRGSVRIPERHDLSSQPRGRGRRPHELRLRGLSYWSLAAPPTRSAF